MRPRPPIRTHSPDSFSEKYIHPEEQLQSLLAPGLGRFFIVKVEEMFRLIRLPVPPSRSQTHTFLFITEGEANMSVGGEAHRIGKGDCLFVPAGQVFSFDQPDRNKGYLCNFSEDFYTGRLWGKDLLQGFGFLQPQGPHAFPLPAPASAFVQQLLRRMLREYAAHGLKNRELLQSCLLALLNEIASSSRQPLPDSGTSAGQLAARFRGLLQSHFRELHQVSEYAALLHVSPNHLNKALRAATGKSPSRWIDERLVLEAKALLHQTALPVAEIAAQLGLRDASYFSRLFRRRAGQTPLAYRRGIEKS